MPARACSICGHPWCERVECKDALKRSRQEAGTPWRIFDALHREYRFTVDVCAVDHNHKLPEYLTPEMDALAAHWGGERAWCNPPYEDIAPWLAHALEADFAAFLLPARTDRAWWREWKPLAEVHYYVGRMGFVPPPGIKYSSNPAPNMVMLFGNGATPGAEAFRDSKTGARI